MQFDESTINRVFGLMEVDSEEFKALYKEPNYELILQEMANESSPCSTNSNQKVMS